MAKKISYRTDGTPGAVDTLKSFLGETPGPLPTSGDSTFNAIDHSQFDNVVNGPNNKVDFSKYLGAKWDMRGEDVVITISFDDSYDDEDLAATGLQEDIGDLPLVTELDHLD